MYWTHVQQKGSLVEPERLRFDFSHFEPLKPDEIKNIERLVNQEVQANYVIETDIMPTEQAMKSGAMALFGEKYGENVRVLKMGDFSKELCGGTHAHRTGDIGILKIVNETGVAAGVRRIEAVTGKYALEYIDVLDSRLARVGKLLKGNRDTIIEKLEQLIVQKHATDKKLEQLQSQLVHSESGDSSLKMVTVGNNHIGTMAYQGVDAKVLRDMADKFKHKYSPAVIVLASVEEGNKVSLVASVSKDICTQFPAGVLINYVATQVGGKGGGRPDMAQAGGDNPEKLQKALESVKEWVEARQKQKPLEAEMRA